MVLVPGNLGRPSVHRVQVHGDACLFAAEPTPRQAEPAWRTGEQSEGGHDEPSAARTACPSRWPLAKAPPRARQRHCPTLHHGRWISVEQRATVSKAVGCSEDHFGKVTVTFPQPTNQGHAAESKMCRQFYFEITTGQVETRNSKQCGRVSEIELYLESLQHLPLASAGTESMPRRAQATVCCKIHHATLQPTDGCTAQAKFLVNAVDQNSATLLVDASCQKVTVPSPAKTCAPRERPTVGSHQLPPSEARSRPSGAQSS